jgi:Glycosyl hydrolases family 25
MKSAGLIRGAYQYYRSKQSASAQANLVVKLVGKLGPGDLPVVFDVEDQSQYPTASQLRTWLQIVELGTGKRPIIYTSPGYWASLTAGKTPTPAPMGAPRAPASPPALRATATSDRGSAPDPAASSAASPLPTTAPAPTEAPRAPASPPAPRVTGTSDRGSAPDPAASSAACPRPMAPAPTGASRGSASRRAATAAGPTSRGSARASAASSAACRSVPRLDVPA